jgi:NAD+ kinase
MINITTNETQASNKAAKRFAAALESAGYAVGTDHFDPKAELTVCVGGDGSLLTMLAKHDFPEMPIIGLNTGHLGFFQELGAGDIDEFISKYKAGNYTIQKMRTVYAEIPGTPQLTGLNEIVIRGASSHLAHLSIYIGDTFIERFCGDGIIVSSPAGSTAYNYSLGGSIVDPRLDLLQVTPIAAINSAAYRSFTSSILLPPDQTIKIIPEYPKSSTLLLTADGIEREFEAVKEIKSGFTGNTVNLIRMREGSFWDTVKSKLL